jgi:hypothetical protein
MIGRERKMMNFFYPHWFMQWNMKQMIGGKSKDEILSRSLTKGKRHILKQQGAPWEKGWCVNGTN